MATALIPICSRIIAGNPIETVCARDLHEFLEAQRKFAGWITNRIQQYGFQEKEK